MVRRQNNRSKIGGTTWRVMSTNADPLNIIAAVPDASSQEDYMDLAIVLVDNRKPCIFLDFSSIKLINGLRSLPKNNVFFERLEIPRLYSKYKELICRYHLIHFGCWGWTNVNFHVWINKHKHNDSMSNFNYQLTWLSSNSSGLYFSWYVKVGAVFTSENVSIYILESFIFSN